MQVSSVIARGNIALVLKSSVFDTVIKVQQKKGGGLESVSPYEIDMCRLLWNAVAETGLSRHLCRFVGTAAPEEGVVALEMEKLIGTGDPGIVNLEDLIMHAAAGDVDPVFFTGVFRALVFQALFTLSSLTFAFKGLFRHNDLHLRNVCFTPWNSAKLDVKTAYVLRCFPDNVSGGKFVDRHFCFSTAYRAVLIDYGWAALLPGLGPALDARFHRVFTNRSKSSQKVVNILESSMAYQDCGMSQQVPCQAYDAALLMYSIFTTCFHAETMPCCIPVVRKELREFLSFYDTAYRAVPHVAGRLSLQLQQHLLRSRYVPGTKTAVPTTESLLRATYFACFRSSTRAEEHTFGLCPSPAAITRQCGSELDVELDDFDTPLAGKGQWKSSPTAITGGKAYNDPPMGSFKTLLCAVIQNINDWKSVGFRSMDPKEEADWVAATKKRSVDESVIAEKWKYEKQPSLSPAPTSSFMRDEIIRVQSPCVL